MKAFWRVLFVCCLAAPLQGFGEGEDPTQDAQGICTGSCTYIRALKPERITFEVQCDENWEGSACYNYVCPKVAFDEDGGAGQLDGDTHGGCIFTS